MRIPAMTWAAAAVVLTFVTACDWEMDGGERLNTLYHQDNGAAATDEGTDAATADTGTTDAGGLVLDPGDVPTDSLAGRWAVRVVQLGTIAPLQSDDYPITTTDYFVATIAQDATTVDLTFCDEVPVNEDGNPDVEFITTVPAALKAELTKL